MLIKIDGNNSVDTDKDLEPAERHILQKLFGWKSMAESVSQFREKKKEALAAGWNNSGPVRESPSLAKAIKHYVKELVLRLNDSTR